MITRLSEQTHFVKGLDPVADAFSATVSSDVVSLRDYSECVFIIYKGVGAVGTSTVTVEACSDFTPSATTAVPFYYRRIANSGDTHGAFTAATSSGFVTTAGSSELYQVVVTVDELALTGYSCARLKMVESVDSPVLGGILIELRQPARPLNHGTSAIA